MANTSVIVIPEGTSGVLKRLTLLEIVYPKWQNRIISVLISIQISLKQQK